MVKLWKKLSINEKVMIISLIVLLIIVATKWQRVSDGFLKGIDKQQDKTEIQQDNEEK